MSMIKCPECGKEISDKAATCPNCGYPVAEDFKSQEIIQPAPIPQSNLTSRGAINTSPAAVQKKKSNKLMTGCLIVVATFALFVFLIMLFSIMGTTSTTTATSSAVTATETSQASTSLTKEQAKEIDSEIWNYVVPVINAHNQFLSVVGNESATLLDIYNVASEFEVFCQSTWNNPPEISDENGKAYLDSCMDYILYEQTMAQSFKKYVDSQKTSDLSEAQKNIQSCNEALSIVASNRGVFLSINQFSEEEIQEITSDLGIE